MSGTISSLGVGSGFELQSMLEQLREVDEAPIKIMEQDKTKAEERITELDVINAKIIAMKSHALSLSLESNFIERSVSSSDEDVVTAESLTGTTQSSHSIEITRLASSSSWESDGVSSADTIVYIPVRQESQTGFTDADTVSTINSSSSMTLTYGAGESQQAITVDLTAGMTLNQIVNAVNTDDDNDDGEGSIHITASTFEGTDSLQYLRFASTSGGSGESNRVMVTSSPESLNIAAPDTSFSYSLGSNDTPVTVSITADTTFSQLATQINEDENNSGIAAAVIDDGSGTAPYKLVLTADNTGEDNRISINGLQMTEVNGADNASLNASVSVNGIAYQRQKNTGIEDILQGITLNLESEGKSTISVNANTEIIETDIKGLIETYNDLVKELKIHSNYDEKNESWGILSSSVSVKGLTNELNILMSTMLQTDDLSRISMYDIGMGFNEDGTLNIDEEELSTALSSDIDDVMRLFLGDEDNEIKGLGDILNDRLRDFTTLSGLIETEKSTAEYEIDKLEKDIEDATERLDRRYEVMTKQFVQLDIYVNQMRAQADYLSAMFNFGSGSSKSE